MEQLKVEGRCPLCPIARPKSKDASTTNVEHEGVITEEMAGVLEISNEWVGWRLCPPHVKEYQARKKKIESKQKQPEGSKTETTANNKKQKRPQKDDQTRTSIKKARTMESNEEQPEKTEPSATNQTESTKELLNDNKRSIEPVSLQPIGIFESCFPERNGTPRQGLLVPSARGKLKLKRNPNLLNPAEALEGLEGFSHMWIVFLFHNNVGQPHDKIHPPRLGGKTFGMLATRSPHRPCPIGLTVAKIESIEGDTIHMSGVDLVNGTPVLDVKPYIESYDALQGTVMAEWLKASNEEEKVKALRVEFLEGALESLREHEDKMHFFKGEWEEAKKCIEEVLRLDIRTLHMKKKHAEGEYGVSIDCLNVVFRTKEKERLCVVERIELWPESYDLDFAEVKRRRLAYEGKRGNNNNNNNDNNKEEQEKEKES